MVSRAAESQVEKETSGAVSGPAASRSHKGCSRRKTTGQAVQTGGRPNESLRCPSAHSCRPPANASALIGASWGPGRGAGGVFVAFDSARENRRGARLDA